MRSVTQLCLTLWDPMDCGPPGSSVHGIFSSKNTGVGCHFLLQGIFPIQGSNIVPIQRLLCLLYCTESLGKHRPHLGADNSQGMLNATREQNIGYQQTLDGGEVPRGPLTCLTPYLSGVREGEEGARRLPRKGRYGASPGA